MPLVLQLSELEMLGRYVALDQLITKEACSDCLFKKHFDFTSQAIHGRLIYRQLDDTHIKHG